MALCHGTLVLLACATSVSARPNFVYVLMDDFWLMVQQENSDTIVMLCNCVEMHKEKSAKYWPEEVGDTLLLGENRDGVDLEVILGSLNQRKQ